MHFKDLLDMAKDLKHHNNKPKLLKFKHIAHKHHHQNSTTTGSPSLIPQAHGDAECVVLSPTLAWHHRQPSLAAGAIP